MSGSDRPSNSVCGSGSPDGKEKTWVTCTAVTWSGLSRPISGETIEPASLPAAP